MLHETSRQLVTVLAVYSPQKSHYIFHCRLWVDSGAESSVPGAQKQRPAPSFWPNFSPVSLHPNSCDRSHRCFHRTDRLCHHPSGD